MLAHEEGVFCEPASAAGLAGAIARGLEPGSCVVCVITGNGLKDPEIAARLSPEPVPVDPDPDAIAAAA
jgi:threonine synthase